jgi:peptidoglycan hydrolase-like protein with peptidoglycan-binding domain
VRSLQQALIAAGIPLAGGADGVFGPATANAVKRYQQSRGLPATGRADAATLNALGSRAPAVRSGGSGGGLARGARGDAVRQLQLKLMQAGIFVAGGADGIFGAATERALKTYQQRKGLPATGRVDAQTARALGLGGGAAPTAPRTYVGLRLGSRGPAVKAVQRAIIRSGIKLFGGADGVFGMATQSALMLYQRAHGIPSSGVVDGATARSWVSVAVGAVPHLAMERRPAAGAAAVAKRPQGSPASTSAARGSSRCSRPWCGPGSPCAEESTACSAAARPTPSCSSSAPEV